MGDAKSGKHRPKVGNWIPAPRGENGYTVVGPTTLKLLGRMFGWNNPGREE